MFRTSDMVLIGVMVAAAGFTYKTKQQAEGDLAAVRKLESQIKLEEDTIDLLKADWSLLTQPSRLQKLVEAYSGDLKLQTTDARQYGAARDIPARPLDIRDIISESGSMIAGTETTDKTTKTGAVR